MNGSYETLDEYLDDLDAIKEKLADETEGMNSKQVKAYFARAVEELQKATGEKVRVRREKKKVSTSKR